MKRGTKRKGNNTISKKNVTQQKRRKVSSKKVCKDMVMDMLSHIGTNEKMSTQYFDSVHEELCSELKTCWKAVSLIFGQKGQEVNTDINVNTWRLILESNGKNVMYWDYFTLIINGLKPNELSWERKINLLTKVRKHYDEWIKSDDSKVEIKTVE